MNTSDSQFELLWARIECKLALPAVVMIGSAESGDGTTATAFGLARSLAETGMNVALAVSAAAFDAVDARRESRFAVRTLPDGVAEGSRRAALSEFVHQSRRNYEVTIVDGALLLRTSASRELVSLVDGVVMSVRVGRPATEYDRLIAPAIRQSKANLLGAVAVSRAFIETFEEFHRPPKGEVVRISRPEPLVAEPAADIHAYQLSFERS